MSTSSDDPPPITVPFELGWSGMTHVGKVRKNNEDTFLALNFNAQELRYLGKVGGANMASWDFVFAVSDGMGGERSGEFASRIAIEKITKLLPKSFQSTAKGLSAGQLDILHELISQIHRDMLRYGLVYEECQGMGATLSLAWFTPGVLYFAHIGDSRIYYLPKEGEMTQITHDHSHVGWLRRQGKLNEREQRMHPRKNALQQALGAEHQFIDPHMGAVRYEVGDRFLLCTDGLIDGIWDRSLQEIVRHSKNVELSAEILVKEALENSGRDNITAIVIEVLAGPEME